MSRPSPEELSIALQQAERLRDSGSDEYYMAKALLSYHERVSALEDVLSKVKHYFHSGQSSHEHSVLLKAIEEADRVEAFLGQAPKGFIE